MTEKHRGAPSATDLRDKARRRHGESLIAYHARRAKLQKQRYDRFHAKGLCRCGRDRVPGRAACQNCLDYDKGHKAKKYRRSLPAKKAFGLCHEIHCNSEAVPGRAHCDYHLDQKNSAQKALVAHRRDQGKCDRCQSLPVPGKMKCQKHLDQAKRNQAAHRLRLKRKHKMVAA